MASNEGARSIADWEIDERRIWRCIEVLEMMQEEKSDFLKPFHPRTIRRTLQCLRELHTALEQEIKRWYAPM